MRKLVRSLLVWAAVFVGVAALVVVSALVVPQLFDSAAEPEASTTTSTSTTTTTLPPARAETEVPPGLEEAPADAAEVTVLKAVQLSEDLVVANAVVSSVCHRVFTGWEGPSARILEAPVGECEASPQTVEVFVYVPSDVAAVSDVNGVPLR